MDVMVSDRKVWTAMETRALITLKEEMKPKFQTMKRNRTLWVELSDKLRKHFGHERTPAQCAVRWKNIMSAYKDSRDALCSPRPDSKICLFFKEVEAILGDTPLALPLADDARVRSVPSPHPLLPSPRKRERSSEKKDASVPSLLAELITKVDAQGAAIARIEKMLAKAGMASSPPVTDILPGSEPISIPLADTVTAPVADAGRAYGAGDPDVLLERPSAISVPELAVTPDAPPQSDTINGAQAHVVTRPGRINSAHTLPSAEQVTQDVGVAHAATDGECVEGVVTGEEVTIPVTGHIGPVVQTGSLSPSAVTVVADTTEADGTAASDGVGCLGAAAASRPVLLTAVEPVVATISKPSEVQGVDGSVGGGTDIDMIGGAVEKDASTEEHASKKQKTSHKYSSAS